MQTTFETLTTQQTIDNLVNDIEQSIQSIEQDLIRDKFYSSQFDGDLYFEMCTSA